MTVIAVKVKKDLIEIASDNQTSWNRNKKEKANNSDNEMKSFGKLYQTNGMTIGMAGSVAHIGLFYVFSKTHKPKNKDRDSVLDWVLEFKTYAKDKAGINFNDLNFGGILVFEGLAFVFYDDTSVYIVDEFDSIGSGRWLCLGSLNVGSTIKEAISTSIKYDLFCGGEIHKLSIKK